MISDIFDRKTKWLHIAQNKLIFLITSFERMNVSVPPDPYKAQRHNCRGEGIEK